MRNLRNMLGTRVVSIYFLSVAILGTFFLGTEYETLSRGVALLIGGQILYFLGLAWHTWELARRFERQDEELKHRRQGWTRTRATDTLIGEDGPETPSW